MATFTITEYRGPSRENGTVTQVPKGPELVNTLKTSAGSAASHTCGASTHLVRIFCDGAAGYFRTTTGVTASAANGIPLSQSAPEYFGVVPNQVISVFHA